MDRLEAMRLFVRVVERRSFTTASHDTGAPRSTVTQTIQKLEQRLGVRLLQRTTRVVRPTLDGEAYYQRCLAILDAIADAEGAFSGTRPRGMLRVDVQGTLARHFLMPELPAFFAQYPEIELTMSETERWVDVVGEGVDCVLRYGELTDSDMVARSVAELDHVTCAAPSYLERHGTPADIPDLSGHRVVGLRSLTTGSLRPLRFTVGGVVQTVSLPATLSVTGTESYLAAICLGLGLAQVPLFHVQDAVAAGELSIVLADIPPPRVPVSLLYPRNRQLSPRVRVFLDWAVRTFRQRREAPPAVLHPSVQPDYPDA